MRERLNDEKLAELLECGITEFAAYGERASMAEIARHAGISVGVIYKYHTDKDAFFLACVRHSMAKLTDEIGRIDGTADSPRAYAKGLIETVRYFAREHGDYLRLYHRITQTTENAKCLADEIEGFTSHVYTEFMRVLQQRGELTDTVSPAFLAFFFDNLLMMLQFTYACPYYRERYRLYTGCDISENENALTEQLLRFVETMFLTTSDKHCGAIRLRF